MFGICGLCVYDMHVIVFGIWVCVCLGHVCIYVFGVYICVCMFGVCVYTSLGYVCGAEYVFVFVFVWRTCIWSVCAHAFLFGVGMFGARRLMASL